MMSLLHVRFSFDCREARLLGVRQPKPPAVPTTIRLFRFTTAAVAASKCNGGLQFRGVVLTSSSCRPSCRRQVPCLAVGRRRRRRPRRPRRQRPCRPRPCRRPGAGGGLPRPCRRPPLGVRGGLVGLRLGSSAFSCGLLLLHLLFHLLLLLFGLLLHLLGLGLHLRGLVEGDVDFVDVLDALLGLALERLGRRRPTRGRGTAGSSPAPSAAPASGRPCSPGRAGRG